LIYPELINSLLSGNPFVSNIQFFDEIESTSEFIKNNRIPDGTIVITNHQTGGKGRFKRKWESEKNSNLTFSILKRFDINPEDQINLVYFFSYSVTSVLNRYLSEPDSVNKAKTAYIKWPNDFMINGKKLGGVLIEVKPSSKEYIVGIGINVNKSSFSTELSGTATSILLETGKMLDLNMLLRDLIIEFSKNTDIILNRKFHEIYSLWKKCTECIGKEVSFLTPEGEEKLAIIDDLLPTGEILLTSNGQKYSFYSGEIKLQF
jgi:BirA family biotin operon repressor/biotin-[acetyl-CoA-carboxylase] ligase